MRTTVFESRPLPAQLASRLRARVAAAHADEPFSTTDPRRTIRRVGELLEGLALTATVYRGGVDLRGAEVDHLWLAVEAAADEADAPMEAKLVLDVAFPLLDEGFLALLRRFVVGDASGEELEAAGAEAAVDTRVLGSFPLSVRYLGQPVWSPR